MAVREPSNNDVNAYLQWVLFAVYGMLGYADGMIREHGDSIRRVAAWLRATMPVKPGTVYRGLLLDPSLLRASDGLVDVDPNYTFLSYTEDKNVACWFADRESTISKSVADRYADASGYIAKRRPRQADILFHYSWGLGFPLAGRRIPLWVIATQDPRMDPRQIEQWLKTQQEVILEPVTKPYAVTPFEDECPDDPTVLEDLDRRLTGRQFAHEVKKRKKNPRWSKGDRQIPTDYEAPVYHVTYSGSLPLIAQHGLQPDRGPGMGEQYDAHRKGAVFLTDPDGLSFWHERAEEWAHHRADDLLAEGVVPVVLRAWTEVPCELDEIGSHDANAPAWKCLGVVQPGELELWSGDGWVPVTDYEEVDFSRAVDDEGYLAVFSENELVPTEADMSFAAKVNPRRRAIQTRAQTRAQRRATQRARLRRLMRSV